jgi:hypothetical protein
MVERKETVERRKSIRDVQRSSDMNGKGGAGSFGDNQLSSGGGIRLAMLKCSSTVIERGRNILEMSFFDRLRCYHKRAPASQMCGSGCARAWIPYV